MNNNEIINSLAKNAGNIIKTGGILLASTIINQTLRSQTNETMDSLTKDLRRAKNDFRLKRLEQA